MTGPDDDFEDFLNRRKPAFRRPEDEMFEPPAELDRVVLRQAREAIKPEEPMRMFSAPRWSMPVALAATLLLTFTIIFRTDLLPTKSKVTAEVTVQDAAQRVDAPADAMQRAPAQPAESLAASSVADARSRETARAGASMAAPAEVASAPAAKAGEMQAWRRDTKSWLAEIQRLRDAGDAARADAEYAELKRQQRAYAVSPDR